MTKAQLEAAWQSADSWAETAKEDAWSVNGVYEQTALLTAANVGFLIAKILFDVAEATPEDKVS